MPDPKSTVGQALRAAREARGLSRRAVTVALGWGHQSQLVRLEEDGVPVTGERLIQLARYLGVSLDELGRELYGAPDGELEPGHLLERRRELPS